jgi:hypothetical protein
MEHEDIDKILERKIEEFCDIAMEPTAHPLTPCAAAHRER